MPRVALDLNSAEDCQKVKGQWRIGPGLVPGQPNEGLTAQLLAAPPRLADFDDSGWAVCTNIRASISKGFTFAWYRIAVELPEAAEGGTLYRVLFLAALLLFLLTFVVNTLAELVRLKLRTKYRYL